MATKTTIKASSVDESLPSNTPENEYAERLSKEKDMPKGVNAMQAYIDAKAEAEKKKVVELAENMTVIDYSMKGAKEIEKLLSKYQGPEFELGKLKKWDAKLKVGVVLKRVG